MAPADDPDGIAAAFAAAQGGDIAGAIRGYRDMLAADPRNRALHYGLGQLLLLAGDFAAGWEHCEWRAQRAMPFPRWRGEALGGATILLHGEQGFGDNFQFVRYAPLVAARGGRVIVAAREGLRPLLATVPGVAAVIEPGESMGGIDRHIPMLSLPYVFAADIASIPAEVPYMKADPARVGDWRRRLSPHDGMRIGIVWSGNVDAPHNWRRSPGLAALRPLLDLPGCTFFILQKGGGRAELDGFVPPPSLVDLDGALASFDDTAAAMTVLDLVITPCTATAHLAGALGRPVWIALARFPDWRWLLDRADSPWYPSARLFRQEKAGDWAPVMRAMRRELETLAAELRDTELRKRGQTNPGGGN